MTNQTKIIIALAVFAVIGIGYSVSTSSTDMVAVTTNTDTVEVAMAENEEAIMETEESHSTDDMMGADKMEKDADMMDDVVMAKVDGKYLAYDPAAVAASEADSIILNFSATWCPSCRSLDKDINANLSAIPDGVEIYKVDYDSNVPLRQQYGVTTQHTFVEIAADGTMIQKWSGGNTLESVVAKL